MSLRVPLETQHKCVLVMLFTLPLRTFAWCIPEEDELVAFRMVSHSTCISSPLTHNTHTLLVSLRIGCRTICVLRRRAGIGSCCRSRKHCLLCVVSRLLFCYALFFFTWLISIVFIIKTQVFGFHFWSLMSITKILKFEINRLHD
jgi:hypothetical protein